MTAGQTKVHMTIRHRLIPILASSMYGAGSGTFNAM